MLIMCAHKCLCLSVFSFVIHMVDMNQLRLIAAGIVYQVINVHHVDVARFFRVTSSVFTF